MKKKLLSIICAICTICMLIPMTISAETYGNFEYSVSGANEVTITGYTSTGDVVIPSSIEGKPVTTIGNNAFDGKSEITSVIIPNSVTSIGEYAFRSTNLTSVTIPGSVENIGMSAFTSCTSLSNVTIENGVTSIGDSAFRNCSSLTNIIIPESVTFIDSSAFNLCTNLTGFQVDGSNTNYSSLNGILFNKNLTKLIRYPQGKTETSYSIPDSVTSIGEGAFYYCDNLTNITIPNSVTSIGYSAFAQCSNLTSITIPNRVGSIGDNAFAQCSNLTSITIPNNVTSIGSDAFMGCSSLQSIFLPDGLDVKQASIPFKTTQVRYSIDEDEEQVTITRIDLGDGKSSVDIPATICGYPVVGISDESLLSKIASHTCAGGQATCQNKAICGICKQEYGNYADHTFEWKNANGQYWEECKICNLETSKQSVPDIVINAPDKVCRTQDTVVSVSLPENLESARLCLEYQHSGGEIDVDKSDGLNGKVSGGSYNKSENSFNWVVYATTSDGYSFKVTKTVQILDNHDLKHISAKDATVTEEGNKEYWQCTVCEKYFSDENGTNEISFEDIVISKLAPEIIKGKGQSVTQGTKKALSFTSNASIDDFKYVKLDGKELDSSKYTVKSGSIIVTLNSDFVSTLKVGKHTISIVSETGEAITEFEVVKKEVVKDTSNKENSNKINTGIIGNAGLWISMMASSINALLIGVVLKKKKMK